LLYTAGLCDVTFIEIYNTYLHGICFLFRLYNDVSCVTPQQTCLVTHRFTHADATRSSSLCWHRRPICCRRTACFVFAFFFLWTHETTRLSFFARPVLWMFHFSSTELGREWTWFTPWRAASLHIFFVRMDNQFANENLPDILWTILSPHDLWIRNALRMVMSVRWKKRFLGLLPSSPGNYLTVHRLSDVSTNPM